MIGVAGMIAEALCKGENDPYGVDMDFMYDLLDDPDCMSESDWQLAGLTYGEGFTKKEFRQIDAAFDLLSGPLWSEVLKRARTMIIESRDIDLEFAAPNGDLAHTLANAAAVEKKANMPPQPEPPVDQPRG